MVNRVILIGNLGRDPEVRRLENGAVVAKFAVATNENYKDKGGDWQTQTEWHDVVVWRNLAERAETTLKKGMSVYLEGKLTHRTWQDQDGNNRRATEVVASYFRIIDKREARSGDGNNGGYASTSIEPAYIGSGLPNEENGNADDDLPF